ncbi:hypothetical protein BKH42_04440 [Helicobacter sp. 13S00482-2]|uniref:outer membrane family protein n=1 Tax=Helicobacter sp. 13S00482-2 TaxID=1476200 RepID=UPI000BA5EBD5|nr:outer membrane family protein [Helicobacter sp. 13S00482-2]PAF53750.1 hypothetical protein BKH42_04440 [Helicobacter sp. 13S00482-2]
MCRIFILLITIVSFSASIDYQFDGWIGSWNKRAFNINNPEYVDPIKGIYPTESYSTLALFLGVNTQLYKGNSSSVDFGFAGIFGGVVYDSTKSDRTIDGKLYVPDGLGYNYAGFWAGYLFDAPYGFLDAGRYVHNVVFPSTYIHYNSEYFEFWGGRYAVPTASYADLFSSYTQGVDLVFKYQDFRIFFEASFGRANASWAGWIYDWYAPYSITTKKGVLTNLGMYFLGADYRKNGLVIRPNFYFYPTLYYTPSLKVSYQSSPDFFEENRWGSKTQFLIFTPFQAENARFYPGGVGRYRYGDLPDKFAVSIDFNQTFNIDIYNVGFGFHKNFGSANGYLGNRGNTVFLVDIWDASVYDIGQSISDAIGADAFTPYIYGGGRIKNFEWSVLGRLTYARRSNEQALRIGGSYNFKKEGILIGGFIEFFRDETKEGYKVGSSRPIPDNPENIADRSYVAVYVKYNFLTNK